MLTISIDTDLCMAYGLCVQESPELFEICSTTGQARITELALSFELINKARAAAEVCPQKAIRIRANDDA
jgi:ferredoxin